MKLFVLFFACAMSFSARAADDVSVLNYDLVETFFQAHEGQFVLDIAPGLSRFEYGQSGFSSATGHVDVNLGVEYGFTRNFSVLISDDLGNSTYSDSLGYSVTRSGFSDVGMTGKLFFDLAANNKILFQPKFTYSPQNQTSGNNFTGGNSYGFRLAYQHAFEQDLLFAAGVQHTYYGQQKSSTGGSTYTYNDYSYSGVYADLEKRIGNSKYGGQLLVVRSYNGRGLADWLPEVNVYAAIPLAEKLSLTPNLSYFIGGDALGNKDGVTKDQLYAIQVDVRLVF